MSIGGWPGRARVRTPSALPGSAIRLFGLMPTEAPAEVSRGFALVGAAALAVRALPSSLELASVVRGLRAHAHAVVGEPAARAGSLYRARPEEHTAPRGAPLTWYGVALEVATRLAFVALSVAGALLPARR